MEQSEIINIITTEVALAEDKHPDWPDDIIHQVSIMIEEAGEANRAALQSVYENGDESEVYYELVQTAAMCIRILKNNNIDK